MSDTIRRIAEYLKEENRGKYTGNGSERFKASISVEEDENFLIQNGILVRFFQL